MEKIVAIEPSLVPLGSEQTVRVTVKTERGFQGSADVPSGISVGANEAKQGSAEQAVQTIQDVIGPALIGADCLEQRSLDQQLMDLDGTPDRSHFGVRALLPISLANCRAAAAALNRPLYAHISQLVRATPRLPETIIVLVEGGKHAPGSSLTIQEFSMIGTAAESVSVQRALLQLWESEGIATTPGSQGGLVPNAGDNRSALEVIHRALTSVIPNGARLALDAAASHGLTPLDTLKALLSAYPIALVEDPVEQDRLPDWQRFTAEFGSQLIVAADDLTVGNPVLIKDAVKDRLANNLVLKLNQAATLSELFDLITLVSVGGWSHTISHRGVETSDDFIVDLAVGTAAAYLKTGHPSQPERAPKFQRLDAIRQELQGSSPAPAQV